MKKKIFTVTVTREVRQSKTIYVAAKDETEAEIKAVRIAEDPKFEWEYSNKISPISTLYDTEELTNLNIEDIL